MSDPAASIAPVDLPGRIKAAIGQMNSITETLVAERSKVPTPSLIYHYTDANGLRGILESGELRFTDIFALNDPSELRHGMSHAAKMLEKASIGGPAELIGIAKHFGEFAVTGVSAVAGYFVACFSACGDDLGQWRAYADGGKGFAVAFDGPCLEKALGKHEPTVNSYMVNYDKTELIDTQQKLVDVAVGIIKVIAESALPNPAKVAHLRDVAMALSSECIATSLLFKHHGYFNEAEYRFLLMIGTETPMPPLKYKNRPDALIRYLDLDWRKAAPKTLRGVRVAPAADRARGMQYARDCLSAFHPNGHDLLVDASDIPFTVR